MIQHQCQDCGFTSFDEGVAEGHQKETDHCLTEIEVDDDRE